MDDPKPNIGICPRDFSYCRTFSLAKQIPALTYLTCKTQDLKALPFISAGAIARITALAVGTKSDTNLHCPQSLTNIYPIPREAQRTSILVNQESPRLQKKHAIMYHG